MSFGASPDLGGNVTAMAPCVSCEGSSRGNPLNGMDYGGFPPPIGAPISACPAPPTQCTSGGGGGNGGGSGFPGGPPGPCKGNAFGGTVVVGNPPGVCVGSPYLPVEGPVATGSPPVIAPPPASPPPVVQPGPPVLVTGRM